MSLHTMIEWCDSAINPVMGCDGCELWRPGPGKTPPPPGERHCYAGVIHLTRGGNKGYAENFLDPKMFAGRMAAAAKWRDLRGVARPDKPWIPASLPRLVFISDMGDALSKSVSFEFLAGEIIDVASSWRHIGIWLTKQPGRMAEFSRWLAERGIPWPANLWALTSITSAKTLGRVGQLLEVVGPVVRGLSVEPLLEAISLRRWLSPCGCGGLCDSGEPCPMERNARRLNWVIAGGESGTGARPCAIEWIGGLAKECRAAATPVFVKQLGAFVVSEERASATDEIARRDFGFDSRWLWRAGLKDPKGGDMAAWPQELCVREFPSIEVGGGQ